MHAIFLNIQAYTIYEIILMINFGCCEKFTILNTALAFLENNYQILKRWEFKLKTLIYYSHNDRIL